MSIPHGPADDAFWQRPEGEEGLTRPQTPPEPTPPPYAGPPRVPPPAPGWRPPVIAEPPPPRVLPEQDLAGLSEAESSARTVTYGVGMVAGAIAIILMCLLCSRLIF